MSSVIDEAQRPAIRPSTALGAAPANPAASTMVGVPRSPSWPVLTAALVIASAIAGYCIHEHAMWFVLEALAGMPRDALQEAGHRLAEDLGTVLPSASISIVAAR